MKIFAWMIAVAMMGTTTVSLAQESQWKEVGESVVEEAVTPAGIKKILSAWEHREILEEMGRQAMAKILVGEKVYPWTSFSATTTTYTWTGVTRCEANDPRLTHVSRAYSACADMPENSDGQHCFANAGSFPLELDPCLDP